jgi:hypothetical protein
MHSPRSLLVAFALASVSILASGCLILDGSFHEREMTSFSFTTASNPSLRLDRIGVIGGDAGKIVVALPNYLDRRLTVLGIGTIDTSSDGSTYMTYLITDSLVFQYPRYAGVDLSRLYFAFSTSGIRVACRGTTLVPTASLYPIMPYSASNILDFTTSTTFTVTAEDNSTADYAATFSIGAQ